MGCGDVDLLKKFYGLAYVGANFLAANINVCVTIIIIIITDYLNHIGCHEYIMKEGNRRGKVPTHFIEVSPI